jgi:hypothetical protein
MKVTDILNEGELDDFMAQLKQADSDSEGDRQENRSENFSKIEDSIRSYREFNSIVNIIKYKSTRKRQVPQGGALDSPDELDSNIDSQLEDKMVRMGLLNNDYGLTDKALSYLKFVITKHVDDPTRKYADRYNPETVEKLRPKDLMGNFPPYVRAELDRATAKEVTMGREDNKKSTEEFHKHRYAMLRKIKKIIPQVEKRLADRSRER